MHRTNGVPVKPGLHRANDLPTMRRHPPQTRMPPDEREDGIGAVITNERVKSGTRIVASSTADCAPPHQLNSRADEETGHRPAANEYSRASAYQSIDHDLEASATYNYSTDDQRVTAVAGVGCCSCVEDRSGREPKHSGKKFVKHDKQLLKLAELGMFPAEPPVLVLPPQPEDPGYPVHLNVYHLIDPKANAKLHAVGLGLYHTGVELLGSEWSFGSPEDPEQVSGLFRVHPQMAMDFLHSHIYLGNTLLSRPQIDTVLLRLENEWPCDSYHVLHKNCNHFAKELCHRLSTTNPPNLNPPDWTNRIARASDCILPRRFATWVVNKIAGEPPPAKGAATRYIGKTHAPMPIQTPASQHAREGFIRFMAKLRLHRRRTLMEQEKGNATRDDRVQGSRANTQHRNEFIRAMQRLANHCVPTEEYGGDEDLVAAVSAEVPDNANVVSTSNQEEIELQKAVMLSLQEYKQLASSAEAEVAADEEQKRSDSPTVDSDEAYARRLQAEELHLLELEVLEKENREAEQQRSLDIDASNESHSAHGDPCDLKAFESTVMTCAAAKTVLPTSIASNDTFSPQQSTMLGTGYFLSDSTLNMRNLDNQLQEQISSAIQPVIRTDTSLISPLIGVTERESTKENHSRDDDQGTCDNVLSEKKTSSPDHSFQALSNADQSKQDNNNNNVANAQVDDDDGSATYTHTATDIKRFLDRQDGRMLSDATIGEPNGSQNDNTTDETVPSGEGEEEENSEVIPSSDSNVSPQRRNLTDMKECQNVDENQEGGKNGNSEANQQPQNNAEAGGCDSNGAGDLNVNSHDAEVNFESKRSDGNTDSKNKGDGGTVHYGETANHRFAPAPQRSGLPSSQAGALVQQLSLPSQHKKKCVFKTKNIRPNRKKITASSRCTSIDHSCHKSESLGRWMLQRVDGVRSGGPGAVALTVPLHIPVSSSVTQEADSSSVEESPSESRVEPSFEGSECASENIGQFCSSLMRHTAGHPCHVLSHQSMTHTLLSSLDDAKGNSMTSSCVNSPVHVTADSNDDESSDSDSAESSTSLSTSSLETDKDFVTMQQEHFVGSVQSFPLSRHSPPESDSTHYIRPHDDPESRSSSNSSSNETSSSSSSQSSRYSTAMSSAHCTINRRVADGSMAEDFSQPSTQPAKSRLYFDLSDDEISSTDSRSQSTSTSSLSNTTTASNTNSSTSSAESSQ